MVEFGLTWRTQVELATGHQVERYEVQAVLGHGGMAVVYRVRHRTLKTDHALKVLNVAGKELSERLLREGQVQARLIHPNVVAVTDVLEVDGAPALLMEYVDGPNLEEWLRNRTLTLDEAETLFGGVLDAVESAHQLGVVHRDLKPGNVMIAPDGDGVRPKVTDFGLAKAITVSPEAGQTRSGMPMGTPAYMSPEQVRDAKNVDARTDIFSLGCILYELVCGRRAFVGKDTLDVFNRVANGDYEPPTVSRGQLPPRIANCIEGCLASDASRRIPDCATLRAVLKGERTWVMPDVDVAPMTLDWALTGGGDPDVLGALSGESEKEVEDSYADEVTDPGPTSRDSLAPVAEQIGGEEIQASEEAVPVEPVSNSDTNLSDANRSASKSWAMLGIFAVGVVGAAIWWTTNDQGGGLEGSSGPAELVQVLCTDEEIATLDASSLRLRRNEIFARHGRVFESEDLLEYFGNQSWYSADPAYDDARLTEKDKACLASIRAVEKQREAEQEAEPKAPSKTKEPEKKPKVEEARDPVPEQELAAVEKDTLETPSDGVSIEPSKEETAVASEYDQVSAEIDAVGDEIDAVGAEIEAVADEIDAVGDEIDAVGDEIDAESSTMNDAALSEPETSSSEASAERDLPDKLSLLRQSKVIKRKFGKSGYRQAENKGGGWLAEGETKKHYFQGRRGESYAAFVVCETGCADIGLSVSSQSGQLLASKVGDPAAVRFVAPRNQSNTLQVTMGYCAKASCEYQLWVMYR